MKKNEITKKEAIKIIKTMFKHVDPVKIEEEENQEGDLYISSAQLLTAAMLLDELQKKIKNYNESIEELKAAIVSDKKRAIVYRSTEELIKNQAVHNDDLIFFLECESLMFINNSFISNGLRIYSKRKKK